MFKRILSLIIGMSFIYLDIYLGINTTKNQSLIVWFGLASAILIPLAFALIGYTFSSKKQQILERLSKVSEVEKLRKEAESH